MKPIICFDSAPYFAALENPEYKADRVYVNQDTLAELEQKLVFAEGEEAENLAKEFNEKTFDKKAGKSFLPTFLETTTGDENSLNYVDLTCTLKYVYVVVMCLGME